MTTETTAAAVEAKSTTGYPILITPISIQTLQDRRGKSYIKARVTAVLNDGTERERTLMARGKALEAINDNIAVGKASRVRVMFSKTDQGAPFLTALCMARHQPENNNDTALTADEQDKAA